MLGKDVFNAEVKEAVAEVMINSFLFAKNHAERRSFMSIRIKLLLVTRFWHQGYFFLADIFKEEEAKLIADRISAQVFKINHHQNLEKICLNLNPKMLRS